MGKDAFNVVFLAGVKQVLVGPFVSAQVRFGSGELWVSGQIELVENALDRFLQVFVAIQAFDQNLPFIAVDRSASPCELLQHSAFDEGVQVEGLQSLVFFELKNWERAWSHGFRMKQKL